MLCPLCGQSLSPEHRQSTLEQLKAEGKQLGDRWRANKSAMEELAVQITDYRSTAHELRFRRHRPPERLQHASPN